MKQNFQSQLDIRQKPAIGSPENSILKSPFKQKYMPVDQLFDYKLDSNAQYYTQKHLTKLEQTRHPQKNNNEQEEQQVQFRMRSISKKKKVRQGPSVNFRSKLEIKEFEQDENERQQHQEDNYFDNEYIQNSQPVPDEQPLSPDALAMKQLYQQYQNEKNGQSQSGPVIKPIQIQNKKKETCCCVMM